MSHKIISNDFSATLTESFIDAFRSFININLTESYTKHLHRLLKSGTSDEHKDWFRVGDYKNYPMRRVVMIPQRRKMYIRRLKTLLKEYNAKTPDIRGYY